MRVAHPFHHLGRLALVLVLGLAAIGTASAQSQGTAEQRAACTPDALRLCSSEIPDIGRVTACMKANMSNLSDRCRATFPVAGAVPGPMQDGATRPVVAYRDPHRLSAHQRRAPRAVLAYHRDHGLRHRRPQFEQALGMAGQVMSAMKMACDSQAMPAEMCGYQKMIPGEFLQMLPLGFRGF